MCVCACSWACVACISVDKIEQPCLQSTWSIQNRRHKMFWTCVAIDHGNKQQEYRRNSFNSSSSDTIFLYRSHSACHMEMRSIVYANWQIFNLNLLSSISMCSGVAHWFPSAHLSIALVVCFLSLSFCPTEPNVLFNLAQLIIFVFVWRMNLLLFSMIRSSNGQATKPKQAFVENRRILLSTK